MFGEEIVTSRFWQTVCLIVYAANYILTVIILIKVL